MLLLVVHPVHDQVFVVQNVIEKCSATGERVSGDLMTGKILTDGIACRKFARCLLGITPTNQSDKLDNSFSASRVVQLGVKHKAFQFAAVLIERIGITALCFAASLLSKFSFHYACTVVCRFALRQPRFQQLYLCG